jgi:hypothetical protein
MAARQTVPSALVNALLRRFVELTEADLGAAGFVRRGPVFRYFDAESNGIVLALQRSTAPPGDVAFYINVGVLLASFLRYYIGNDDPRLDAMPHHGVWQHRLVAADDTARWPDHKFGLSTDADAERAATIVRVWVSANLPRMMGWLGDFDAMLGGIEEDNERRVQAKAEQVASGQWKPGRWPEGHWADSVIRVYAHAERGDVDAVAAEIAGWRKIDEDPLAADVLALANRRRTERQG